MSTTAFATVEDIEALYRPLSPSETTRAEAMLPLVSDELRNYGINAGVDLDEKAEAEPVYANVLKIVTVDVVFRVLRSSVDGDPMTQESQSGLGYSWSGSYAIPGGGIAGAILNNDLKRLGLLRQTMGVISLWESSKASQ
jgi:hypothetical protein